MLLGAAVAASMGEACGGAGTESATRGRGDFAIEAEVTRDEDSEGERHHGQRGWVSEDR